MLIFHSCANHWVCHLILKSCLPFFVQFLAFLLIFAQFWTFFAHTLCAKFSYWKFCQCYLVSFFPSLLDQSIEGELPLLINYLELELQLDKQMNLTKHKMSYNLNLSLNYRSWCFMGNISLSLNKLMRKRRLRTQRKGRKKTRRLNILLKNWTTWTLKTLPPWARMRTWWRRREWI